MARFPEQTQMDNIRKESYAVHRRGREGRAEQLSKAYGKKTWLIPDAFLHSVSMNDQVSHEAICVLNTSDTDAAIQLTLYFEDRDKIMDFTAHCGAGKTHHIRLDRIRSSKGEAIPRDIPYAILVESNIEIVVQYSRLDTSAPELALMTTIAYPVED